MAKCPSCGAEIEAGVKFCSECGAKIPQNKECPQCQTRLPLLAKFCGECGYNFMAAGGGKGSVIGDKNVIAGDVHVDQSSTVNNTTTNNVVNNTTNNTNNVSTTNNYISQDETKHLVECVVCKRKVVITEARTCKECHQPVCPEHYDSTTGMCATCASKRTSDAEATYRKELEVILEDGIVDRAEFDQLEILRQQLGLSASRAMELQKIMKAERSAKKQAEAGEAPLRMVEKAQCDRARDLLFDEGRGEECVKLLESIYQRHPLNEDVLSIYLAALFTYDEDRAKSIISSLRYDMVRAYLVMFDIEMKKGDLAAAEVKLTQAESLWPENMLLKCRHAELMYATAIQLDDRTYLAEAMDWLTSLAKPADKLEATWQFYVEGLISQALGDAVPVLDRNYCKQNNLYYALVNGQITGLPIVNEEELCDRCMKNRCFSTGAIPALNKGEFKILQNAAKRGEPRAALVVGDCYFDADGNGVTTSDMGEAFMWYRKAADLGLPDAQMMAAVCLESGLGCDADQDRAVEYYKIAASRGNKDAQAKMDELGISNVPEKKTTEITIENLGIAFGYKRFYSIRRALEDINDKELRKRYVALQDLDETKKGLCIDECDLTVLRPNGDKKDFSIDDVHSEEKGDFFVSSELDYGDSENDSYFCISKTTHFKLRFRLDVEDFDIDKLVVEYENFDAKPGDDYHVLTALKYDGVAVDCEIVEESDSAVEEAWCELSYNRVSVDLDARDRLWLADVEINSDLVLVGHDVISSSDFNLDSLKKYRDVEKLEDSRKELALENARVRIYDDGREVRSLVLGFMPTDNENEYSGEHYNNEGRVFCREGEDGVPKDGKVSFFAYKRFASGFAKFSFICTGDFRDDELTIGYESVYDGDPSDGDEEALGLVYKLKYADEEIFHTDELWYGSSVESNLCYKHGEELKRESWGETKSGVKQIDIWSDQEEQDADALDEEGNDAYEKGNIDHAFELCLKAAEMGVSRSQRIVAEIYASGKGSIAKDEVKASEWYIKAAEQGNRIALNRMGVRYENGRGVAKDAKKAVDYYRRAAEAGYADAQSNLGISYYNGDGIEKDLKLAAKWYSKASDGGSRVAKRRLAKMYIAGEGGLEKSDAKARTLMKEAAEAGDAIAQNAWGLWCDEGKHGVPVDDREAVKWYRKSAEKGNVSGQYNLGLMLKKGEGCAKDLREALSWFEKAAANGHDDAPSEVSAVKAML